MSPTKIAFFVVGVAVAGAGLYFGNEEIACRNLEDDYLNAISDVAGSDAIGRVSQTESLDTLATEMREEAWDDAETALGDMWDRCGERRAREVHQRGNQLIMELY
ncbi:MAG: hypothetical protein WBA68_04530 [Alteraurantiacibacter sp.]